METLPRPQFHDIVKEELWFDESLLVSLLKYSLSLGLAEKDRILSCMHTLTLRQIEELVRVFLDEQMEFTKMVNNDSETKHIELLVLSSKKSWQELEAKYDLSNVLSDDELNTQIGEFLFMYELKYGAGSGESKERAMDDQESTDDIDSPNETTEEETDEFVKNPEIEFYKKQPLGDEPILVNDDDDGDDEKTDCSPLWSKFDVETDPPSPPKPQEALDILSQTVIGQAHALQKLTTAFFYHKLYSVFLYFKYLDQKMPKQPSIADSEYACQSPLLLIGDTGTGKTHIIKQITKLYQLNVITVDCSTLVRTGIVGTSLDTIGRMIYDTAPDVMTAQTSVVFLDEFDKLFVGDDGHKLDIALQLLGVMEGSSPFPVERSGSKDGHLPTHLPSENMLFILAGSFGIHRQGQEKTIGFHTDNSMTDTKNYNQLTLTKLNLPDELAGRIGQIIHLDTLNHEQYADILYQSPSSPWTIFQNQLALMECTAELPRDVVMALIEQNLTAIDKFGARGLYQAFNRLPCLTQILLQASEDEGQSFTISLDGL